MAEIRVNVSSVGSKGTAQATNNAAQYWAEKAREWAISENPVSMEDNSSKYYAGKAKEYAQSAQQYKNDTQEIADTAESNIDDLTSDFSSLYTEKSEALQSEYSNYSSSLEAAKTSAITSIQTTGTEVNTSITTASTSALSDITTAKNTAVEDIQDEADTQISNIQSTGFYMRDGRLYYVDSEGQEQEFKSGEGLPLLSIRPALYVDESLGLDYYLNGQLLTVNANLQGAVNALKSLQAKNPSLFTTGEEWQAEKEASDYGQVGKFVFNYAEDEETVESVRLPAVVNVQGLLDLQNLGVTVAAGLPNLTLYTTRQNNRASGGYAKAGTTYVENLSFLASSQNPIYGAADTVQEEAIQYPWVIRLATGQETEVNIRNDIELNNPFFFGMSQYFDVEPNNLSWLKSDGMYKPKSVYPDYYNWILENVNKGVEGFKGQEGYCFIATDSSGYYWWVSTESPVVGASVYRYDVGVNSMFFDGTVETLTLNGFTFTSIFEGSSYTVTRDSSKDTSILHPTAWITDYDFVINTSDETFKLPLKNGTEGMFGGGAGVVPSGWALYYYVGETVQNANLIDAGRMQEQITNINAPSRGYLVQSYVNGTSGYRVYSDGWCEQWGRITVGQDAFVSVTFLKPFMNASYYANWISCNGETQNGEGTRACDNLTTTSMRIYNGQDCTMLANWHTCGY